MCMEKFEVGKYYKLDEIRAVLGGPLLASIATKENKILYVKFKREKSNPNLPEEVWIKNGPLQMKSALSWVESIQPIPMFFKSPRTENSNWKYLGLFKAKILYQGLEAATYSKYNEIGLILKVYN
jgi:hypothetical protein